ncbi:MAG: hypothetical protein KHX55_03060 [Proteobacteria bacterium]|nr:hypothetical protein [Pseudomonadota bacterium]
MSDDLDENINSLFQRLLPLLSSVFLVLLSYLPLNFLFLNTIHPAIGLICGYFWLVHRPDLFNLWSICCLGLVDDVISAAPMGSSIFAMLVLYVLTNAASKFLTAKPFVVLWYGFVALSLGTILLRWLVVSVYYSRFLPLGVLFFSYLITVFCYPLVSLLLAFVQNTLIQDEE